MSGHVEMQYVPAAHGSPDDHECLGESVACLFPGHFLHAVIVEVMPDAFRSEDRILDDLDEFSVLWIPSWLMSTAAVSNGSCLFPNPVPQGTGRNAR